MSFPTNRPATWFITGTSRGLGLELVKQLLQRGDRVAATTRSPERLRTALGGDLDAARLLPLAVDLRDQTAVTQAVRESVTHFGTLDAVVNNAGYGLLAAVEETSDSDVRSMLDVQVIGVWNVLRAVVPYLREQRRGHIVNISSILGLTAVPGWALYCAGKFALEGLSEALAAEMTDFGVKVTIVEPGYLRTDFLCKHSLALPAETSAHYPAIREMTQQHLNLQGSQLGDPAKAATAIIDQVVTGNGPLRQLLGSDAHSYATAKAAALQANINQTATTASATDFPATHQASR